MKQKGGKRTSVLPKHGKEAKSDKDSDDDITFEPDIDQATRFAKFDASDDEEGMRVHQDNNALSQTSN